MAYQDYWIGQIFDIMRAEGVLEETFVVLSSYQ